MVRQIGSADRGVQGAEVSPSPSERASQIVDYLSSMSQAPPDWGSRLTTAALGLSGRLAELGRIGFEVIQRMEGPQGCEGLLGAYRLEYDVPPKGQTNREQTGNAAELVAETQVATVFTNFLDIVTNDSTLTHSKWVSPEVEDYFMDHNTYPTREADNPLVRLLVPLAGGWGFVDVSAQDLLRDLRDPKIYSEGIGKTITITSSHHLMLNGDTQKIAGVLYAREIIPVARWEEHDRDSLVGEPPLLVLSLAQPGQEVPIVRSPRILAHLGLGLDSDGRVDRMAFDFAHTPILGMQAKQLADSIRARSGYPIVKGPDLAEVFDRRLVPDHSFVDDVKVSRERYTQVIGGDPEMVFGADQLLLGLAQRLDVFVMKAVTELNKPIDEYIRSSAKYWGGQANLDNLALLMTSGQAPYYMVDSQGSHGLQVALGLGGPNLLTRLRGAQKLLVEHLDPYMWSKNDLAEMASFNQFWLGGGWRERHKAELLRAKLHGRGSITGLALLAGDMRDQLSSAASMVDGELAVFSKGRCQGSDLGTGMGTFWTAASRDVGTSVSRLGERMALQLFAKDPVIWAVLLCKVIGARQNGYADKRVVGRELFDAMEELLSKRRNGEAIYQDLDEAALDDVSKWVLALFKGERIERANLGLVNINRTESEVGALQLLHNMSEDTKSRAKGMAISRVMAGLVYEMAQNVTWQTIFTKGLGLVAHEKLLTLVTTKIQLALIADMCQNVPSIYNHIDRNELSERLEEASGADERHAEVNARLWAMREVLTRAKLAIHQSLSDLA